MSDSTKHIQFCQHCRKPMREIRSGSLTSWVFKASTCTCKILPRQADGTSEMELPASETSDNQFTLLKLGSRFQILSELGHGGMGTVYVGRDNATGELVAIKVLRDDLATNEAAVKRFQEEVLAAQYLTHPNRHHGWC